MEPLELIPNEEEEEYYPEMSIESKQTNEYLRDLIERH
jgi:hypothetical protein